MMKPIPVATALSLALIAVPALAQSTATQPSLNSSLDGSLRLGLVLDSEPDTELSLQDRDSRIRWQGNMAIGEGMSVLGYLEFGFDQDNGVSETREGWIGLKSDSGVLSAGRQHRAFYDAVTARTHVSYLDECRFAAGCERRSSVIKYTGAPEGELRLLGSVWLEPSSGTPSEPGDANPDDAGNFGSPDEPYDAFIDQFDVGAKLDWGSSDVGAALSIGSDSDEPDPDTGVALGVGATVPFSTGTASVALQYASDDYVGGEDAGFGISTAAQVDNVHGILNIIDVDGVSVNALAGYTMPILQDQALLYFEVEVIDLDGRDLELIARSVLVFNFDVYSAGG